MNAWMHGLLGAAIGGFAGGVTTGFANMMASPEQFNLQSPSLLVKSVLIAAIVSGITAAAAYLKQSPLPPQPKE